MLKTVVKQRYSGNVACDTSGYCNHGVPADVTAAFPGFGFGQTNSRIDIRPSPSLNELVCIRTGVTFSFQPSDGNSRYNLLEGFESFSLFINEDRSITGTIFDEGSSWSGSTSAPGVVSTGEIHTAIMECDGINMVRLSLDGSVIAENYGVLGAVRDIGSYGLTVGHWPDSPDLYAFEGTIFEILLEKYDATRDLTQVLDPCCFDRAGVARFLQDLNGRGISTANILSASGALQAAARKAAAAARGGDKARTIDQQNLASALTTAIQSRNVNGLESILNQWQASAAGQIDAQTMAALTEEVRAAIDSFGFTFPDWFGLMKLFCLNLTGYGSNNGASR